MCLNTAKIKVHITKTGASGYVQTDNWALTASPPSLSCYPIFNPNKYYKIINRNPGKPLKVMGDANINLSAFTGKAAQISLFNSIGQVVLTQNVVNAGNDLVRLDIAALSAGTYHIKVKVEGQSDVNQRLVFGK